MRANKRDISIIIINYNSSEYTQKCIESILDKTSEQIDFEILVVDNASERKDFEILDAFISKLGNPDVSLYRSRINTGFGGGNMHGIQYANAKYYLFLNNDTTLRNDAIGICLDFMERNRKIAVCGAQLYNEHGKKQLSFDHFTSFMREVFGKKALEIIFPKTKPDRRKLYAEPIPVDYVNGSFMFFRAPDFNEVGGFDTNLFLYFEESDICYRLIQKGKKTYFVPTAEYLHYHGKSIGKTGMPIDTKIELKTSMFYVIRKNYGYFHYQFLRLFFIVRYAITCLVKPQYFKLLRRILIGLPQGKSLKMQQVIVDQDLH
jgi:GT2 family glycosyltransferase